MLDIDLASAFDTKLEVKDEGTALKLDDEMPEIEGRSHDIEMEL